MFATFVSVALLLAVQGARADFDMDTPVLVQCQPATITWTGTNAEPYSLIIVPTDDVCGDELADLGEFNTTTATWTVNIPAGQDVTFSLQDALGAEAWSGSTTVQSSNDTSCLNSTLVSSSAAASSAVPSSIAVSSVGSATTLYVSPVASPSGVANDVPAASSSGAAIPVGAANSGDNPTSAGFSMHQLSTPIMVVSAVAALVLSL